MKYQGKVSLQATAETVWDVVLDIEQFADWGAPGIISAVG